MNLLRHGSLCLAAQLRLKNQRVCGHGNDKIILILHQLIQICISLPQPRLLRFITAFPFPLLAQSDQKLLTACKACTYHLCIHPVSS